MNINLFVNSIYCILRFIYIVQKLLKDLNKNNGARKVVIESMHI